jgi:hypothetical protein
MLPGASAAIKLAALTTAKLAAGAGKVANNRQKISARSLDTSDSYLMKPSERRKFRYALPLCGCCFHERVSGWPELSPSHE